jgi:hypothetical protein
VQEAIRLQHQIKSQLPFLSRIIHGNQPSVYDSVALAASLIGLLGQRANIDIKSLGLAIDKKSLGLTLFSPCLTQPLRRNSSPSVEIPTILVEI